MKRSLTGRESVTQKEKDQYEKRYEIDGYYCHLCGKRLEGLGDGMAHRIAKTSTNKKVYGAPVIRHNFNLVPACSQHNDFYNIGNRPNTSKRLADLIHDYGSDTMTAEEIDVYLREL
jgi:hypothetical protein